MAEELATAGIGKHGADRLPSVDIDSYNIELKDDDGFLGDRASKGAFQDIVKGSLTGAVPQKAVFVLQCDVVAIDIDSRQPIRAVLADAGGRQTLSHVLSLS